MVFVREKEGVRERECGWVGWGKLVEGGWEGERSIERVWWEIIAREGSEGKKGSGRQVVVVSFLGVNIHNLSVQIEVFWFFSGGETGSFLLFFFLCLFSRFSVFWSFLSFFLNIYIFFSFWLLVLPTVFQLPSTIWCAKGEKGEIRFSFFFFSVLSFSSVIHFVFIYCHRLHFVLCFIRFCRRIKALKELLYIYLLVTLMLAKTKRQRFDFSSRDVSFVFLSFVETCHLGFDKDKN